MSKRRDGEETRRRILEAAAQVFSDQGFRDATHAEICEIAGANIAAINYHFGSKEELYAEVVRHLSRRADELYPVHGGIPEDSPPEERLRVHVGAIVRRMTDSSLMGQFHRIIMKEHVSPTGLLHNVLAEVIEPYRENLKGILRELLGPRATDRDVECCEASVMGQVRMARSRHKGKCGPFPASPFAELATRDADGLVEHITRFSLGGIEGVRRRLEGKDE